MEEEEEEEYEEPPPKKVITKQPLPPPEKFVRRQRPTDEELYSKANIEMLRARLYQQTRQRLNNDLFGY